jgi:hypothetical protein
MKRNYYVLLLILLGACNIKEQSEIQSEVLATKDVISISADSLVNAFAKDSAAAADLYMDKVLSISGDVRIFEQFDTIDIQVNDTLPSAIKWVLNRIESDVNTTNIIFDHMAKPVGRSVGYQLNATFPREYRQPLKGVKEKSKLVIRGRLEFVNTLYVRNADSTRTPIAYYLSLQGCVVDKKD